MSGAAAHARCPRCGAFFHCGADDATPCACTAVILDRTTLAQLRERFSGCLCLACLRELARAEPGGRAAMPGTHRVSRP